MTLGARMEYLEIAKILVYILKIGLLRKQSETLTQIQQTLWLHFSPWLLLRTPFKCISQLGGHVSMYSCIMKWTFVWTRSRWVCWGIPFCRFWSLRVHRCIAADEALTPPRSSLTTSNVFTFTFQTWRDSGGARNPKSPQMRGARRSQGPSQGVYLIITATLPTSSVLGVRIFILRGGAAEIIPGHGRLTS